MVLTIAMIASAQGEVPTLWTPPEDWPATLRDIASRLPEGTDARDADPITYAHEGTHFLATGARPGHHGLYILGGWRVYIPTPPLVTEEVLGAVAAPRRGDVYSTYLRQGQADYWLRQPLMILDEWVAYSHGSMVRQEAREPRRQESDRYCAVFAGYARVLCDLAKGCEGYDSAPLLAFCRWQDLRCEQHIPRWRDMSEVRFDDCTLGWEDLLAACRYPPQPEGTVAPAGRPAESNRAKSRGLKVVR